MAKKQTQKPETPEEAISLAKRYLDNAKQTLKSVEINERGLYQDAKYTSSACGIAYLGALAALNAYLLKKGIPKDQLPESVEGYNARIKEIRNSQLKKALYEYYTLSYDNLHILGYYRHGVGSKMIREGMDAVRHLIREVEAVL